MIKKNKLDYINNGRSDMRIAHFSWEYPPVIWGGLGTFATEITQKQVKLGNEVTVFTYNNNKLSKFEIINGVEVFRPNIIDILPNFYIFSNDDLRSWGSHLSFFTNVLEYNMMSASTLVKSLVSNNGKKFDIIDAHDWLGVIGGIIAKKELGIPLMFHVHSTEIGRSGGNGSTTLKDIEFEGGKIADCIVTVSYAMREELKSLGFPEEKIRVCWNGIDTNKYDPTKITLEQRNQFRRNYGVSDDEYLLFFIGRLVTIKGVENLIRAMPILLREYPKLKLLILGIGDLENKIRKITKELGITDKIIIRNEFVSEEERILHYSAADMVVLPSLYEPFGIVCTEAMSMAKPVVVGARGTSGMREQVITNGPDQCGVHINPHDPKDIAWGIKQILELEDKGIMMGQYGRKRAIEQFTWDIITNKTLEIYKEFMK